MGKEVVLHQEITECNQAGCWTNLTNGLHLFKAPDHKPDEKKAG
ncbi:MAG: hypothetical protein AB1422_11935 [bacterium]